MLNMRTLLAVAILPFLATSSSAQTGQQTDRTGAIRAECFRQANEAARAQVGMLLLIPLPLPKETLLAQTPTTRASVETDSEGKHTLGEDRSHLHPLALGQPKCPRARDTHAGPADPRRGLPCSASIRFSSSATLRRLSGNA